MTVDTERLKRALTWLATNEQGVFVLRYLCEECGFAIPSTVINPATGEINFNSTVYNEARRSVYLRLRQHIPNELLQKIELPIEQDEPKEGPQDENETMAPPGPQNGGRKRRGRLR